MEIDLEIGHIVVSTAGRDAGQMYVVVGRQGPDTILVADGRRRGVKRPKRKNPRHLKISDRSAGIISPGDGRALTDEMIRAFIMAAGGFSVESGGHGG